MAEDAEPITLEHINRFVTSLTEICGPDDDPGSALMQTYIVSKWVGLDGGERMVAMSFDPRSMGPVPLWDRLGMLEASLLHEKGRVG